MTARHLPPSPAAAIGCVLLALAAHAAGPVDVTQQVRARPDLMGRLEQACARVCQGNRSEARLERVTALALADGRFRVEGEASLRQRHVQAVPGGLGGLVGPSVTLFDHTALVHGRGLLDPATCLLEVEAVEVVGDRLGLGRLVQGEVGRRHRVERCRELLPRR